MFVLLFWKATTFALRCSLHTVRLFVCCGTERGSASCLVLTLIFLDCGFFRVCERSLFSVCRGDRRFTGERGALTRGKLACAFAGAKMGMSGNCIYLVLSSNELQWQMERLASVCSIYREAAQLHMPCALLLTRFVVRRNVCV